MVKADGWSKSALANTVYSLQSNWNELVKIWILPPLSLKSFSGFLSLSEQIHRIQ